MNISAGALRKLLFRSVSSNRRIITVAPLLLLLLSGSFGALFVNLVYGNFTQAYFPPLTITIQLPESNKIYTENSIRVTFTVQRAYKGSYTMFGDPRKGYYNVYLIAPPESYTYFLDGKEYYFKPSISTTTDYYLCEWTLHRLTEGTHRLRISAISYSFTDYGYVVCYSSTSGSSSVVFTVNTAEPHVSVLSPRPAKTYNETTLPLNFTVSEPCNWMGYSLDGQKNVTITGNTTLTRLTDGTHTLVVYAEDTAGSTGASSPVTFKVETQTAAQPTEPQPEPPNMWVSATIIVLVAAVSFGLVAYFVRVKRKRSET